MMELITGLIYDWWAIWIITGFISYVAFAAYLYLRHPWYELVHPEYSLFMITFLGPLGTLLCLIGAYSLWGERNL